MVWSRLPKREGIRDEVRAFVGNIAEGYSFPTKLDRRVRGSTGMAPSSEQDLLINRLESDWRRDQMLAELQKIKNDSSAHARAIKQRSV